MTTTFKSEDQTSVEMVDRNAQELLTMLGKTATDPRGVFAVDQIPAAIDRLDRLIESRSDQRQQRAKVEFDDFDGVSEAPFEVDISLRAIPLRDLLEHARQAKKPVTWGI